MPSLIKPAYWTAADADRFDCLLTFLPMYRAELIDWFADRCDICDRTVTGAEDRERLKDCVFCDLRGCPYKLTGERQ